MAGEDLGGKLPCVDHNPLNVGAVGKKNDHGSDFLKVQERWLACPFEVQT